LISRIIYVADRAEDSEPTFWQPRDIPHEVQMKKPRILSLTYKTFPATLPAVRQTTLDVMQRMGFRVISRQSKADGSTRILASGWRLRLYVELEAKGSDVTRARVVSKEGVFFGYNAVADLVACVAQLLEHQGRLSALPAR
jgi:hypothetical protein